MRTTAFLLPLTIWFALLSAPHVATASLPYTCSYAATGEVTGAGGELSVTTTYVQGPDGAAAPPVDCLPGFLMCTDPTHACRSLLHSPVQTSAQLVSNSPTTWLFTPTIS